MARKTAGRKRSPTPCAIAELRYRIVQGGHELDPLWISDLGPHVSHDATAKQELYL